PLGQIEQLEVLLDPVEGGERLRHAAEEKARGPQRRPELNVPIRQWSGAGVRAQRTALHGEIDGPKLLRSDQVEIGAWQQVRALGRQLLPRFGKLQLCMSHVAVVFE